MMIFLCCLSWLIINKPQPNPLIRGHVRPFKRGKIRRVLSKNTPNTCSSIRRVFAKSRLNVPFILACDHAFSLYLCNLFS